MAMFRSPGKVKRLPDGRSMINVGCGFRTNSQWNNIDFSPYVRLARYLPVTRAACRLGLISRLQMDRIAGIDREVIVWDLRRGIPFPEETFDVVYHSHFLEHLPRDAAPGFLTECRRVLRVGGRLRVVVPDLERTVKGYVDALAGAAAGDPDSAERHERTLHELFDQMVRRDRRASARLHGRLAGWVQGLFRGDAARIGEMHLWMYDRVSLPRLLEQSGFGDFEMHEATTSGIEGWDEFHLDRDPDGTVYKQGSLYVEARKLGRARAGHGDLGGGERPRIAKAA